MRNDTFIRQVHPLADQNSTKQRKEDAPYCGVPRDECPLRMDCGRHGAFCHFVDWCSDAVSAYGRRNTAGLCQLVVRTRIEADGQRSMRTHL